MANTLLTPTVITKEALMILHQKCNFIGNIETQYDSQYAKSGAKIGNDLKIRLPNEFTIRTGATLNVQDVPEESVTLTVDTQKGVDFTFASEELTMHIDDFRERYLEPAMSVLAANMESDSLSMYKDVWNLVDGEGAAQTYNNVVDAGAKLSDNLAPSSQRFMLHSPTGTAGIIKDTKSLFNDARSVSKSFKEGALARTAGFDHFENTLMPTHTTGTAAEGATSYLIDNTSGESASAAEISAGVQTLTIDTGSTTFLEGDIITIANVFRVHPETKASTGVLQQFVVQADSGASATSLTISPPIISSGVRQNVDAAAANNAAINKVGGGNASSWGEGLAFHKTAFAFATADLVMPSGVDFSAREVLDGLSMRIVRQYDINNDKFPCRLDVIYGYKAIRPQLACRVSHD